MGSKGIRRRKLARRSGHGQAERLSTPPVMWPDAASGFEADAFSPAGTAERFWSIFNRPRRPTTRRQEWVLMALAAGFLMFAVTGAIVFALTH